MFIININHNCLFLKNKQVQYTRFRSCRSVAPGLNKIRMDDLEATMPPIVKTAVYVTHNYVLALD